MINQRWAYLLPFLIFFVPEHKVSLFGVETFFSALILPMVEFGVSLYFLNGFLKKKKNHRIYFFISFSLFCAEIFYVLTTYWTDRLGSFAYQLSVVIFVVFAIFTLSFLIKEYAGWITKRTFLALSGIGILYFIATIYFMNPLVSHKGFHAVIDIIYNFLFSIIFAYSIIFSIRENNISRFMLLHGLLLVAISEFGIHYYNYLEKIGSYAIFFEKVWALGIFLMFVSFFDRSFSSKSVAPFKSLRTTSVFLVQLFLITFILVVVFSKFLTLQNTASFASFLLTAFVIWVASNYIGMMISKMLLTKSKEINQIRDKFTITETLDGPLYKWVNSNGNGNQTVFFEINRVLSEYNSLAKTMMEEYSAQTRFNTIGRISECAISELDKPLKKISALLEDTDQGKAVGDELAQIQTYVDNMHEVSKNMSVEPSNKDFLSRQIQSMVQDYLLVCQRKRKSNN